MKDQDKTKEQLISELEGLRRRVNEAALQASEERFRNYFDQGLIGMAVTSVDKRWLEVNDRLCEIMGHSREELLQSNWAELTHPEDLEPNVTLFNRLLAGEIDHYTLDKRFFRKDGSIVYTTIHIRAFRHDDGTIDHVVALTEDITARKEAEQALQQSHDELQAIYDVVVDGLAIIDMETRRLVRVNSSLCRMLGYSDEELQSRPVSDFHPPEEVTRVLAINGLLDAGGVFAAESVCFLRKDGRRIYADIAASQIVYNGRLCLVGFVHDTTERRQAEEALRREHRTLRHLLQSSDHERQLIAYEIHDGLAQQLAGAIMQFQVFDQLKDRAPNDAAKAYDGGVTLLRQSHFEARRLISGVRPPILDESGVVEAVAHLVHEQSHQPGPQIAFRSKVHFNRLAPILENAIYRIAQEALTNARAHSGSREVWVSLRQRGDKVRIEVKDFGVGFDPKAAHENRYGLRGIRERARLLGGKCRIQSKPGRGTTVVVELPVVAREEEE